MITNPKTTLLQITENIQHPNGGLGGRNAGVGDFRICQLLFPSEGGSHDLLWTVRSSSRLGTFDFCCVCFAYTLPMTVPMFE